MDGLPLTFLFNKVLTTSGKVQREALSGSVDEIHNEPPLVWYDFKVRQWREGKETVISLIQPSTNGSKTYINPVKQALEYQLLLDKGEVVSRASLARKLGVSRAKVTQVLNLLKLDGEIQSFILGLEDTDKRLADITERKLRRIIKESDPAVQKRMFLDIVGSDFSMGKE